MKSDLTRLSIIVTLWNLLLNNYKKWLDFRGALQSEKCEKKET
jgi:hypothetical protein